MARRKTLEAIILTAITMAIAISLTTLTINYHQHLLDNLVHKPTSNSIHDLDSNDNQVLLPSERVSRLLASSYDHNHGHNHHGRSLRPADHCHKDYEVCYLQYGVNSTCCGNKCFDLSNDKSHCGACHNKCKYTYSCCQGQCVDLAFDKRHCGTCDNKCLSGQYCIYGMCDYA